jgi:hypothetical protein
VEEHRAAPQGARGRRVAYRTTKAGNHDSLHRARCADGLPMRRFACSAPRPKALRNPQDEALRRPRLCLICSPRHTSSWSDPASFTYAPLLEGVALWSGAPMCAVITAGAHRDDGLGSDTWGDDLWPFESPLVRFDFAICPPRARRRLVGVGDFRDVRLVWTK